MSAKAFFEQQRRGIRFQWESMDAPTKLFAVFIGALFVVGGVISGLFIISTGLVVMLAFCVRQAWQRIRTGSDS